MKVSYIISLIVFCISVNAQYKKTNIFIKRCDINIESENSKIMDFILLDSSSYEIELLPQLTSIYSIDQIKVEIDDTVSFLGKRLIKFKYYDRYKSFNVKLNDSLAFCFDVLPEFKKVFLSYDHQMNTIIVVHSKYKNFVRKCFQLEMESGSCCKVSSVKESAFVDDPLTQKINGVNLIFGRRFNNRVQIQYNDKIIESNLIVETLRFGVISPIIINFDISNKESSFIKISLLDNDDSVIIEPNLFYQYLVVDYIDGEWFVSYANSKYWMRN